MINFFRKHTDILLLFGVIFTIISPWLFTRSLGILSLGESKDIGTIIGGITAPITSLIGALLIYFALIEQRHSNKIQSENNSNQMLLTLILDLENKCNELVFLDNDLNQRTGIAAFNSICSIGYFSSIRDYLGAENQYHTDLMTVVNFANFYNIIGNANLIYENIRKAEVDKTSKDLLVDRFNQIFTVYLRKVLIRLDEYYTKDREKNIVKYDMYFEKIIEFNHKVMNNKH